MKGVYVLSVLAVILVLIVGQVVPCVGPGSVRAASGASSAPGAETAQDSAPSSASSSPAARNRVRTSITILPQMELLTAVQTQTSWAKRIERPGSEVNDYYIAVKEFMSKYKDNEAVRVCQELLDRGFSYDAPATFILYLGPLPDLDLVHEYSDYLIGRAGGREKLEEFRLALRSLAQEADFVDFLAQWEPKFRQWIDSVERATDLAKVARWWEDFTGISAGDEYHIVLCPAAFYNNYGPRIRDEATGAMAAYNIAAARPGPGEPSFGGGNNLEKLSIHEIGHSFVNPTFEPFADQLSSILPLYRIVESKMKEQSYPSVGIFLNEQVIRAAQVIAEGELYGPENREASIRRDESLGFHMTSFVVERLEEYAANRDKYLRFTDYVPVLLEQLAEEAKVVQGRTTNSRITLCVLAALGLVGAWFLVRRKGPGSGPSAEKRGAGSLEDRP